MASYQGDFSKGKVSSAILRLGIPMMLAEMVNVLYNIVDRMYLGHMEGAGTAALTGIGLCFPLISLTAAFASLCCSGGAPLMTIARGEGDDDRALGILETSFTMLVLVGAFLTVLFECASPWLLLLLGGDEATLPTALAYFRVYAIGSLPVMISTGMNGFINAQGFPKTGMITIILGATLNILLDPLFIYTFGMGITGAALATVLSQLVGALWVLLFLTGKKPPLRLKRLHIDSSVAGGILRLGATGFTFKVTNSITQACVNIMLKSWGGEISMLYVGATSLINSIREIIGLTNNGVTGGAQSVISYNYGARLYKRVSSCIRFTLISSLSVNIILWAFVMLLPEPIIRIFTNDEQLIALTVKCARIFFGAFPFMALQSTGQSTFVAMNYPKHALFFSLLRKIVLVTPLTLLLPGLGLGAEGVFWAEFISQVIGASVCFTTMVIIIWRKLGKTPDHTELSRT